MPRRDRPNVGDSWGPTHSQGTHLLLVYLEHTEYVVQATKAQIARGQTVNSSEWSVGIGGKGPERLMWSLDLHATSPTKQL